MSEELNNIKIHADIDKELASVGVKIEEPVAEAVEEAVVAPVEAEVPVAAVENPVEKEAREMGWVPKEMFDEDVSDKAFVSAAEFVDRAKLYKKISNLSRKNREIEAVVATFSDHVKRQEEVGYKKALAEVESAKRLAVEAGDIPEYDRLNEVSVETAKQAEDAARQHDDKIKNVAQEAAVADFTARNKWFNPKSEDTSDLAMTAFAQAISNKVAKQHPELDAVSALEVVEREVKKQYPTHFNVAAPANVVSPTAGAQSRAKKTLTIADVPANIRDMVKQTVKLIPGYTEERYIKELIEQGVISND